MEEAQPLEEPLEEAQPLEQAQPPEQAQPYAGITVIEFGQFIAVPYCAMLLAEGGATVIKVEALDGDPTRAIAPLMPGESRHFITRNRGKRSLPLNLKHPLAAKVIDSLLTKADVALTNLRPGLGADLGLDGPSLTAKYPRLVVGNVTAFGNAGPDAGLAGMDLVLQARSGLMASGGRLRDGLPAGGDAPLIDYMSAMMLAFGVASALLRRHETGRGGEVDVSLLMAGMALQNNFIARVDSVDEPALSTALQHLDELRHQHAPYVEQAAAVPAARPSLMTSVYVRVYPTADSVIGIACSSANLQRAFMRVLGLTDRALSEIIPPAEAAAHFAGLGGEAEAVMLTRTTGEWKARCAAEGVPGREVQFPIELLSDPQTNANGMIVTTEHPSLGPVQHIASPIGLNGAGFRPQPFSATFGSDTRGILREIGLSEAEIDTLIASGASHEGR